MAHRRIRSAKHVSVMRSAVDDAAASCLLPLASCLLPPPTTSRSTLVFSASFSSSSSLSLCYSSASFCSSSSSSSCLGLLPLLALATCKPLPPPSSVNHTHYFPADSCSISFLPRFILSTTREKIF